MFAKVLYQVQVFLAGHSQPEPVFDFTDVDFGLITGRRASDG